MPGWSTSQLESSQLESSRLVSSRLVPPMATQRLSLRGSLLVYYELPEEGLEPSLSCPNGILNPARLPIPPLRQVFYSKEVTAISMACKYAEKLPRIGGFYRKTASVQTL